MKKLCILLLSVILIFGLISCDESSEEKIELSGETVWLPYLITVTDAEGKTYDLQTIELNGNTVQVKFYNGTGTGFEGYDIDIVPKDNTMELIRTVAYGNGQKRSGKVTYSFNDSLTKVTSKRYNDVNEPASSFTDYDITYTAEGNIANIIITDTYSYDGEETVYTENRVYTYGETSYTISYVEDSWIGHGGENDDIIYHKKYDYVIPYDLKTENIKKTVSYVTEGGAPITHGDYIDNTPIEIEKFEYEVNHQGFCVSNVCYLSDGTKLKNVDAWMYDPVSATFNADGMPVSVTNYSGTGEYSYDDNGNLTKFVYKSDDSTISYQLKWKEFPKEAASFFSLYADNYNFAISEIIEDICPSIEAGPAELTYKFSDFLK